MHPNVVGGWGQPWRWQVVMQEVGGSVQDEGIAVGFTLTTPEQLLDMQRFKAP